MPGTCTNKQLRGCTVHLRPLTPYLTTLIIRTVPYMMPAPLGPNHALDSFGIRVQAEQASRRELPGGMGGGEVCRAMSSTAWTPQEVAPPTPCYQAPWVPLHPSSVGYQLRHAVVAGGVEHTRITSVAFLLPQFHPRTSGGVEHARIHIGSISTPAVPSAYLLAIDDLDLGHAFYHCSAHSARLGYRRALLYI